jgi:hypothetical protein
VITFETEVLPLGEPADKPEWRNGDATINALRRSAQEYWNRITALPGEPSCATLDELRAYAKGIAEELPAPPAPPAPVRAHDFSDRYCVRVFYDDGDVKQVDRLCKACGMRERRKSAANPCTPDPEWRARYEREVRRKTDGI